MKSLLLSILIGAIALLQPAVARADEAGHRKAAESLLSLMNMDSVMSQSIDQMLQMQIKQNPFSRNT
jgi:L-fucose mutarotase/ribose pyranase (RbsD/FucU family)